MAGSWRTTAGIGTVHSRVPVAATRRPPLLPVGKVGGGRCRRGPPSWPCHARRPLDRAVGEEGLAATGHEGRVEDAVRTEDRESPEAPRVDVFSQRSVPLVFLVLDVLRSVRFVMCARRSAPMSPLAATLTVAEGVPCGCPVNRVLPPESRCHRRAGRDGVADGGVGKNRRGSLVDQRLVAALVDPDRGRPRSSSSGAACRSRG